MLNDKTILITGGTGSFGKAFIKMTCERYAPKKIIIYSRDEYKQSLLKEEFSQYSNILRFFIGDVRDKDRLYRAFDGVDYVIHAAAMKQVPACEYNPFEAILTNIHGAKNVVDAAIDRGVEKVVALSTDKAVNPVNLYGGTKLVSDKLFVSANAYVGDKNTCFSVVRYGNVAGSRGSVIPFFKRLIQQGETALPITNEKMTRFWITLDQGVELVYKALSEATGGEIYISKIPSFRICDLANTMLPHGTTKIVGIREGEKLHEVMITPEDARFTYEFEKHYVIYPNFDWWDNTKHQNHGGVLVDDDFEYNSGKNEHWLQGDDLLDALSKINE